MRARSWNTERYSASTTATRRRPPLVLKATRPSRLAKIVSSRPMPAPGPGRKRVPRCRTMIVPDVTPWPSKTLTPSILGAESRPFLDDPSPFLCAISVLFLVCLERGERALALCMVLLVLERGRDLLRRPVACLLGDLLDGHVFIAARQLRGR